MSPKMRFTLYLLLPVLALLLLGIVQKLAG